jgi:trimeric autotransporter adhesin
MLIRRYAGWMSKRCPHQRRAYPEIKEQGSMSTAIRPVHTAVSSPLRIDARRPRTPQLGLAGVALVALSTVMALGVPAAPAHAAGAITVTTTVDEYGAGAACALREAVRTANDGANFGGCALSGTPPFTINLPAGTYQLTIAGANNDDNATGDLDFLVSGTALVGAGAASTIIQQTTADRVIDFNPTVASNFSGSLSNLRITGGNVGGTFGGGGIIYGDSNGGGTLTLNGVTVDGNTATQGPGGGIASGARGNLTITNSTISNNTASSPAPGAGASAGTGGGIDFLDQGGANQLTITNSTISGNRAAWTNDAGGGLHISGGTATIQRTHFVSNRAANGSLVPTGLGGAIAHGNGTLNVSFSRFAGNTGTDGAAIWQSGGGGTTTANDNWWGANGGPVFMDLAGTPAPTAARWLQLRHSANPSAVPTTTSTTLTADLLGLSTGGSTAATNLVGLPPFDVIFDTAVLGTLSGAATLFTNGQATATYTAGATSGVGSANATADSETVLASITITAPDLTVTKTHAGSFTQGQTGATYTIKVTNSGTAASSGTVSVVDTLPTGLTATALSGTNWSCILGTLTCTRSDALGIGASYEDITLTVDVAATAAPSVTNTATVSGGGEANTGNDTANDPTTVVQAISETLCGLTEGNSYNFTTVNPVAIQIDAVGTLDCITVTRTDANHPNATPAIQTGRFWAISGAASGGGGATGFQVTLTLPQANLPNPSVCRHMGGGVWDCDDGTHTTSTASTVTRSNISAFSDWAVGSNVPTAVSLAGFAARGDETPYAGVLLAGGILGLGGLWLARRRRQLVRMKVGDERTPDTRA